MSSDSSADKLNIRRGSWGGVPNRSTSGLLNGVFGYSFSREDDISPFILRGWSLWDHTVPCGSQPLKQVTFGELRSANDKRKLIWLLG